jgi:hypothetical protein
MYFIIFLFLLFIWAYNVWVISPPFPNPLPFLCPLPLPPYSLTTRQKLFCPYLYITEFSLKKFNFLCLNAETNISVTRKKCEYEPMTK